MKHPLDKLNVAPRVDGVNDHSDTCNIMHCVRCGAEVWVNKLSQIEAMVFCFECAEHIEELKRLRESMQGW